MCPQALIKLPEQEQSIYYMLFGFIATKGAGPNGTVEGERESLTRGTTCARLHGDEEAPLGGGATAAAAYGDVSPSPSRTRSNIRKSVSFLSERASSGSLKAAQLSERSRPLRELGALMRRGKSARASTSTTTTTSTRRRAARRAGPCSHCGCSSTLWLQPKRARGSNPTASRLQPYAPRDITQLHPALPPRRHTSPAAREPNPNPHLNAGAPGAAAAGGRALDHLLLPLLLRALLGAGVDACRARQHVRMPSGRCHARAAPAAWGAGPRGPGRSAHSVEAPQPTRPQWQ
eukprot:scaffold133216_cov57-Phaeocystis_antarctica.AAC.8